MLRQATLTVLAALLVVWAAVFIGIAAAADKPSADDANLVGKWEKQEKDLVIVITITKNGDDWSISGVFYEDGKDVGGFTGKEVKYIKSGELSYISHIDKAPPAKFAHNDVHVTIVLKDGKIIEHWHAGKSRGSHTWTPAK